MAKKSIKERLSVGPVITIIVLILITMIASTVLSMMEVGVSKSVINNNTLESSPIITVNNALSFNGIISIIKNSITNLELLRPLFLLIMSLMAIGIGEASGLFQVMFKKVKKINIDFLIFLTLLVGIVSSIIGEYSYIILIPLVAVIYEQAGKKPLLGIYTIFLGITLGYGAGLFYNMDDITMGISTSAAATATVDSTYVFNPLSNLYIMITATILLCIVGTSAIKKFLYPKIGKNEIITEEKKESGKGLFYSLIAFLLILVAVIYEIVPGAYKSGLLLGPGNTYIEKLLGSESPFNYGILFIFLITLMICGFIYGFVSKNFKDTNDYSVGLSVNFEELGYLFVLLFFTAQLLGLLNWTNIPEVISSGLVNLVSRLDVPAFILVVVMFFAIIIMSIFIPGTTEKWTLISPIMVPLFMKASTSPDYAQMVFKAADSIGKCITPLFVYFIILLAFLEKYNTNEKKKITIFGTLKLMMPVIIIMACTWLVIILGWYVVNLPLGPSTHVIL